MRARAGVTAASQNDDPAQQPNDADEPRRPPLRLQWWYFLGLAVFAVALYVGLPRLVGGIGDTWGRLSSGKPLWLCAAALFEVASYASYVFAFHRLFADPGSRIGRRESYDISLAGVAASRLIATAGAGGIALTAWALERSGMAARDIASRLTTFYVALYALFMATPVVAGIGLRTGLFEGSAPFALTVVPAGIGALVIACGLLAGRLSNEVSARAAERLRRHGRLGRALAAVVGGAGTVTEGVRGAIQLVRRRDSALLGTFGWWAFDIATLWACFRAFGEPPPPAVVVMSYFIGQLANVVPVPGGLGAVDGGMIGAFVGFGVSSGLAVAAVLSYRLFAYWLPTIPGALSYVRLLRTVSAWDREGRVTPDRADATAAGELGQAAGPRDNAGQADADARVGDGERRGVGASLMGRFADARAERPRAGRPSGPAATASETPISRTSDHPERVMRGHPAPPQGDPMDGGELSGYTRQRWLP